MSNSDICKFEGCERGVKAKGLCHKHYTFQQNKKRIENNKQQGKICKVNGCERGVSLDGYCQSHYTNQRKKKKEERNKKLGKICKVNGCERGVLTNHLCGTHYDTKQKIKTEENNKKLGKICKHDGCERGSKTKGYCFAHYQARLERKTEENNKKLGKICKVNGCERGVRTNGYCQNLGDTLLSTEPERCHELGKSATSLSVTKNEVKNELSMSATFSDQDTLPIDDSNPNSKDYGVAGFSVEVSNPIEYVKAHPSAQPQYNGHWSIQKFGINTRAKSNVRTNLTFREDSGFAANAIEPELRSKAIEIQETLNGMLGQNEEYDISESISHKVSKADSINHTLERSYVSDDEKVICVDLPEIDSPKDCYICLDSNDQQTGDKVYATSFENAQTLCDSKGSGLNPVSCDWCFSCLDSGGAVIRQVNAADATAAQQLCPEGTVQPCDLYTADKCYKCEDNFGGGYLSEVWAASLTAAQAECDDQHLGESTAVVCPSGQGECYLCKFNGIPLATIYAHSSEEALGVCKQEYSQYDPSTITATQPCSGIGESTCYKCVTDDGQNIAIVYDSTQAGAQQQCDMAGEESIAQPCTNGGGS